MRTSNWVNIFPQWKFQTSTPQGVSELKSLLQPVGGKWWFFTRENSPGRFFTEKPLNRNHFFSPNIDDFFSFFSFNHPKWGTICCNSLWIPRQFIFCFGRTVENIPKICKARGLPSRLGRLVSRHQEYRQLKKTVTQCGRLTKNMFFKKEEVAPARVFPWSFPKFLAKLSCNYRVKQYHHCDAVLSDMFNSTSVEKCYLFLHHPFAWSP